MSYNNVGNIYKAMGEGNKALEFFEKSLKVRQDLVSKEPQRSDFRVDLAISCWNMFNICPGEDEIKWLTQAKNILQPMREAGLLHAQLEQLWGYVKEALEKRGASV
ncbi:MAG: hypothetical protein BWK80_11645 [Desulfobacteraceae bacterium IS3]|nr:MAG: hypothetical protein BWK80_11645 [Desulfobacteraceae bacterium IS3]